MTATFLTRALVTGTFGSLASTAALMAVGAAEGLAPCQPTNATAHWLRGPIAAAVPKPSMRFTGVGYATHHAATTFWALGYERWAGSRVVLTPASAVAGAIVVSAVAAAVDYGATPKRFTPGWEYILRKRSIAVAYAAMAAGLAAGALLTRQRSGRP